MSNNQSENIILTGDRPTGPLHLGHFIGSLKNRIKLQNEKDSAGNLKYKTYVLIADMQALTDNADNPKKIQDNVLEVMLDYLAVGIDPKISTIHLQSGLPALAELTMYYLNLVNLNQVERNPTVKEEIKQKGFGEKIPTGFFIYPVSQAADITAFKANLVPVGADQIPMIEDTNYIVRKFNRTYCAGYEEELNNGVLKECRALVPENFARLPGLDGKAKMSKSLDNAIFLRDSSDELWQKVRSMYTDPEHIKVEDPGKIEGNMVFTYLDAFDPDTAKVAELKEHYQRGGLGDMKVKKYLFEVLENMLAPIRERRSEFAKDTAEVMNILNAGTQKAREVTNQTLADAKGAMGLNYFTKHEQAAV